MLKDQNYIYIYFFFWQDTISLMDETKHCLNILSKGLAISDPLNSPFGFSWALTTIETPQSSNTSHGDRTSTAPQSTHDNYTPTAPHGDWTPLDLPRPWKCRLSHGSPWPQPLIYFIVLIIRSYVHSHNHMIILLIYVRSSFGNMQYILVLLYIVI